MTSDAADPDDAAPRTLQAPVREILASLNALSLSEMSRVEAELIRAQSALMSLGQDDLGARVAEAREALRLGNVKEFRRAISNVTARLGHVHARSNRT